MSPAKLHLPLLCGALLLLPSVGRADGATQAMSGVGMAAISGLCLFTSALIDDANRMVEEEGGEVPEESPYARRGVYLGLGAAFAIEGLRDLGGLSSSDSFGLRSQLGMRCSPHFAAEADFEWVEGFDIGGGDRSQWALTVNAKWHPVDRWRVQPFLLAGVGFLGGDVVGFRRRTDTALRFGGGLDLLVVDRVKIYLDGSYVLPTGNVKDLRYVSIGLGVRYRF